MTQPPIRVLHVIPNLDPAVGTGPAVVLGELAREQRRQGLHVSVVTIDPPGAAAQHVNELEELGARVHFTGPGGGFLKMGPTSREITRRLIDEGVDLVHTHGMWLHLTHWAAGEAHRRGIPYVVSAHGMLEPWALRKSRLRKQAHLLLRGRRDLVRAAAIHATANMEARNVAALGLGNPVVVVPIGVELARFWNGRKDASVEARWPALAGKRRVLFLGRIDPVKGTLHLAEAWGKLSREFPDWRLVIAGADWQGHRAVFEAALDQHGGRNTTEFLGPVYGAEKAELLASCDLMVQPSFQENFGISIAESLASARPVITTKGTPWQVLESSGIGWWIDIGPQPLFMALADAMRRPSQELDEMGRHGRKLVEERFTWPMVASRMTDVYSWLLNRASRPRGVYMPGEAIPQ